MYVKGRGLHSLQFNYRNVQYFCIVYMCTRSHFHTLKTYLQMDKIQLVLVQPAYTIHLGSVQCAQFNFSSICTVQLVLVQPALFYFCWSKYMPPSTSELLALDP